MKKLQLLALASFGLLALTGVVSAQDAAPVVDAAAVAEPPPTMSRRHGLDADVYGTGADDDDPGPGAVLRRHGPQEERAGHGDAELRHLLPGGHHLGGRRLQHRFRQWQRLCRRPEQAFLRGIGVGELTFTIPETVWVMFQMTFAIITPALITGAFADRMKFSALLLFMVLWSVLVYAPIAHWVWGGGFSPGTGVLDFAGGTVVHINAGIAGLVAALMLGKRRRLPDRGDGPHNLVYTRDGRLDAVGRLVRLQCGLGCRGQRPRRHGDAGDPDSQAAGAPRLDARRMGGTGKPSVLGIISGAVAGLVAITPASGFVAPGGAIAIGLVSGVICFWSATGLKNTMGYDDSLDAFGVHGVGGMVGAVLTGVFATEAVSGGTGLTACSTAIRSRSGCRSRACW